MTVIADVGVLSDWAARSGKVVPRRFAKPGGIRFGFYGRMSTLRFQDHRSSRWWQRQFAGNLVGGHGEIVTEFFDAGVTRRRLWTNRPEAARLLALLADPGRGFDAVVIGEFERAFYRGQVAAVMALFDRFGVPLWLPEFGGPLNLGDPDHVVLVAALEARSGREVSRATIRTTAAMRAQVQTQGRSMGGRPPYGYRYADGGPHPNKADACWGRRLHVLEPDPDTARWVRWIFVQRLAGQSYAAIAEGLGQRGVLCPSKADPDRNRHRSGAGWQAGTVRAILTNPKYTGRQVWGRQRNDRTGCTVRGWNDRQDWVISTGQAHPALVSEADFIAVQPGQLHLPAHNYLPPDPDRGVGGHVYVLTGAVFCGMCGRRMDPHWAVVRAAYRCRHGQLRRRPDSADRQQGLYLREDHPLEALAHAASRDDRLGWVTGKRRGSLAAIIRRHKAVIVCDRSAWTVEWPGGQAVLWPSDGLPANAIPAQRRPRT